MIKKDMKSLAGAVNDYMELYNCRKSPLKQGGFPLSEY